MTNQYSYEDSFADVKVEAPKKKIAESNISSAAKVYMLSRTHDDGVVRSYRNGIDNGQKYMTGEDFVTYFQRREKVESKRENVVKSTVSSSEIYRSRPENAKVSKPKSAPKRDARPAYGAPNVAETIKIYRPEANKPQAMRDTVKMADIEDDDVKIYVPGSGASKPAVNDSATKKFSSKKYMSDGTAPFNKVSTKIKKVADEWAPSEEIVKVKNKKKSRPFSRMILAVAGTVLSLMLIVSGSVLISGASRDVKKLEKELNQLKAEENDLALELEMKNDVNVLRTRATDELGMIRKEYVEANYLDTRGSDSIEAYEEEEKENVGIAAILSAFGLAD